MSQLWQAKVKTFFVPNSQIEYSFLMLATATDGHQERPSIDAFYGH
jgi:hypothetical protein